MRGLIIHCCLIPTRLILHLTYTYVLQFFCIVFSYFDIRGDLLFFPLLHSIRQPDSKRRNLPEKCYILYPLQEFIFYVEHSQTARPSLCSFFIDHDTLATSASCYCCDFLLCVHYTSLNVVIHSPFFSYFSDVVRKSLHICPLFFMCTEHVLIVTFPVFSTHARTYISISFFTLDQQTAR